MTIWLTSDQHFGHENLWKVFKLADGSPARKFNSTEEMDEIMIANWNSLVTPQDHVWCLGDFCMNKNNIAKYAARLAGHKRIVLGNHDFEPKAYYAAGFQKVAAAKVLDRILFTHIPVHPMSLGRFVANVHGHTHTQPNFPPHVREESKWTGEATKQPVTRKVPYLNICVEQTEYRPISLEEVKKWIAQCAN